MSYRQRFVATKHRLQDFLGLPVNYTGAEFRESKRRVDRSEMERDRIDLLSRLFGLDRSEVRRFVDEAGQVEQPRTKDGDDELVPLGGAMSREDRTTLYAVVRATKPETVIETGTADGVSATYILAAFERNQRGYLYSIDHDADRDRISQLIPEAYRDRVELLHGDSLSILRGTLNNIRVDVFLHDSHHSYSHMKAEFNWALPHMPDRGVICSHDVLYSNAWKHFVSANAPDKSGVIMNFGVCLVEKPDKSA